MRTVVVGLLSVAALLGGCSPKSGDKAASASGAAVAAKTPSGPAGAIAALTMPKPREGVWESKMAIPVPGRTGGMTMTSQVCLDAAMLKDNGWMRGGGGEKSASMPDCTQTYRPTAGGYTFMSNCKMAGRTVVSSGTATGDFKTAYTLDIVTRMDPPAPGQPAESKMTVAAHWIGPCAPGQTGVISTKMAPAG